MDDIRALIAAAEGSHARGERYALATVVRVVGSAYRRAGARMLITASGQTVGVVSGGCLDADIRERAARVIDTRQPTIARYDTSSDDELVWGLGLGCNGVVDILIEPDTNGVADLLRFLASAAESDSRSAIATVIRSMSSGTPIGSRVLLSGDGIVSDAGPRDILPVAPQLLQDLKAAAESGAPTIGRYGSESHLEAFIEPVERRVRFVIIGAGADAVPLVALARTQGWHVTVVDTQTRPNSMRCFHEADAVLLCRPADIAAQVPLSASSAVVVMTHNFLHDLQVLPAVLQSGARYIGVLGSRRRTARLLSQLPLPTAAAATALHAPVGLDLGAETPSEIALSIAAEVLASLKARAGHSLRDVTGPIHGGSEPTDSGNPANPDASTSSAFVCGLAATV